MDLVQYKQEQCNEYEKKNKMANVYTILSCLQCYTKRWSIAVLKKEVYKREERTEIEPIIICFILRPQDGFRFDPNCDFFNGLYICLVNFLCKKCFSQIFLSNPSVNG